MPNPSHTLLWCPHKGALPTCVVTRDSVAGREARRLLPTVSLALWLCCALAGAAWAFDTHKAPSPGAGHESFYFDIPSLPLDEALRRYATLTRQPTLVPGDLVAGRVASAVRGTYPPDTALGLLLEGTGLKARRIPGSANGGFTLTLSVAPPLVPHASSLGDLTGYPGLVQVRVWKALCASPDTRPGNYRALLRFQIDSTGHIQRVRLLSSSGSSLRDTAISSTLQAIRLDRAPPPHLPQPLTLLVEPQPSGAVPLCDDGASRHG